MKRGWQLEYTVLADLALRAGLVATVVGFALGIVAIINGNVFQGITFSVLNFALAVVFERVSNLKRPGSEASNPESIIECPDCKELVTRGSRFCRQCGCKLVSQ